MLKKITTQGEIITRSSDVRQWSEFVVHDTDPSNRALGEVFRLVLSGVFTGLPTHAADFEEGNHYVMAFVNQPDESQVLRPVYLSELNLQPTIVDGTCGAKFGKSELQSDRVCVQGATYLVELAAAKEARG